MRTLRLVLGDQLSRDLPSLSDLDSDKDLVLMAEVMSEVTYVKHHKRKIAYLFSAMRHFANSLGDDGIAVRYRRLDDPDNAGSLADEVANAVAAFGPDRIVITAPGEYRLADEMAGWQARFGLAVDIRADTRFLCSLDDFAEWAEGRKSLRMEFFYRDLRRRYQVLMEGDEPIGGKWNYDADNRQPPKVGLAVPPPSRFAPDAITTEVLALVEMRCADDDWAILGGYAGVNQFVKIGAHSMIGGVTHVAHDIPAYVIVSGQPAAVRAINSIGLERRGFKKDIISVLRKAYKLIYLRGLSLTEALAQLELLKKDCEAVELLIESLKSSKKGIHR